MRKGGYQLLHRGKQIQPGATLRTASGESAILVTGQPPVTKDYRTPTGDTIVVRVGSFDFPYPPAAWGCQWVEEA